MKRTMSLSSPVIVPAKAMRTTRPRESSTIACRPPSSTPRGEYIGKYQTFLARGRVYSSSQENKSYPRGMKTRVSRPPPRTTSRNISLRHHVRFYPPRSLIAFDASFQPTFVTYIVLSSSPLQGKSRTGWAKKKEPSPPLARAQLSSASAQPNASSYYPNRRLHWRRAWQAEATLASTLLAPCNPRLTRAPPYAAIRARPAGASAASGETYILRRAESTTEKTREKERKTGARCQIAWRNAWWSAARNQPDRNSYAGVVARQPLKGMMGDADCCYCCRCWCCCCWCCCCWLWLCSRGSVGWRRIDKRRREKRWTSGEETRDVGISVRGLLLWDVFPLLSLRSARVVAFPMSRRLPFPFLSPCFSFSFSLSTSYPLWSNNLTSLRYSSLVNFR